MRWLAVLAVALTGCGYDPLRFDPSGGGGGGGDDDARVIDMQASCFGTVLVVCPVNQPGGLLTIDTNTTIDTDNATCIATEPALEACVIGGSTVTVATGSTLRATGSKPLVVLATSALTVDGTIDVASRRGALPGAGANPPACEPGTPPTGAALSFGGGAGGSFGDAGGNGGPGNPNGVGGQPAAVPAFAVRGGCRGATGGNSQGNGGSGGGAVVLIAPAIAIGGTVNASGAGGDGTGVEGAGGSGGGSGGAIVLDATMIELAATALVIAKGGGGGEGSGGNLSDNGDDAAANATPASGGSGNSDGGDGGAGATTAVGGNGNPPTALNSGGGGGGGGCGVIRAIGTVTDLGATVVPPAS